MKLKRTDIYAILLNSLPSYAVLISIEHIVRQWLLHVAGSYSAMRVLPLYELLLLFLLPIFVAGIVSICIPALSKWNKQPHARLVTFFTIIGGYLLLQVVQILATISLSPSPTTSALIWVINILGVTVAGIGSWQYFYAWKSSLRLKLAIATATSIVLYLTLPLFQNYAYRLIS